MSEAQTQEKPVATPATPARVSRLVMPEKMPIKALAAMVKAMQDMPDVDAELATFGKEDGRKSQILAIEKMVKAIRTSLLKHGLLFLPWGQPDVIDKGLVIVTNKWNAKVPSFMVDVWRVYYLVHVESGEYYPIEALGQGQDGGDKALQKAETYCIKNALRLAFLIAHAGDEPDRQNMADVYNRREEGDSRGRQQQGQGQPRQQQQQKQQPAGDKPAAAAAPQRSQEEDDKAAAAWAQDYAAKNMIYGEGTTEADLKPWGEHFGATELARKAGTFGKTAAEKVYRYLRAKWFTLRLAVCEATPEVVGAIKREIEEDKFLKGTEQQAATLKQVDEALANLTKGVQV